MSAGPAERSFADECADMLTSAVANEERAQIIARLKNARRYVVGHVLSRTVHEILDRAPNTVERNLDLVRLPYAPATWIEIDDRSRREGPDAIAMAAGSARVGYLITAHPDDAGVLVAAVFRKIPDRGMGACHLMPALLAVNTAALSDLAAGARRYFSRQRDESLARMMMQVHTYHPPGFLMEMHEIAPLVENFDVGRESMRVRSEASGEAVYLLGLLLALRTPQALAEMRGGAEYVELPRPPRAGLLRRIGRAIGRPDPQDIVRTGHRTEPRPAIRRFLPA